MPGSLLTTAEVAHRLGVKPATVYAYVSRGLLASRRNADGKGSLFARADVDAFVAGRTRTTTPAVRTGLTLIRDGALFYRGRDACALARDGVTFEAVTSLLWTGRLAGADLLPQPDLLALARAVVAPLPAAARSTDRLRVVVAAVAAADPLRFDTAGPAVVATGQSLLATMVAALPDLAASAPPATPLPLAATLWTRLTPRAPEPAILNAALVLLADHDIAASTLAARVAASTRAHPYAVVSAGLAALDGPLHGAASALAHTLLAEALTRPDPIATVADCLRTGEPVPGFGHHLYPGGDPRAATLLAMLPAGRVRQTAERIIDVIAARSGVHPNVDLALAALTLHHGMPSDAGEAIFAVARTAGWLAHALEEYAARPARFRFSGQYAGPPAVTAG
jgi:citrate synthase